MQKLDCTVIGDAMVDILLPLSEDLDQLTLGGVVNTKATLYAGGTANVAINISQLGGRAAFIGRVGRDPFGQLFQATLDRSGVVKNVSVSQTHLTGLVFSLVHPNGERSFIVDRGANVELRYRDVDLDVIRNSRYLYFVGYSFQDDISSKTIQRVIQEVSSGEVSLVFNPGAPNLAAKFREFYIEIIKRYVDILILNRAEAQSLIGSVVEEEVAKSLLPLGLRSIVLTRGQEGSSVITGRGVYLIEAHPTDVVDTTGAGDAYAAAFIYSLSRGWGEEEAGSLASKVAAKLIAVLGPRLPEP
jgi:hypothetical protein